MRKSLIVLIAVGILILIMSSIRVIIPIINDITIPNLRYVVNVTPGMDLIINDINGSLSINVTRPSQNFVSTLELFAPLFTFVGILIVIISYMTKGKNSSFANPLFFTVMVMAATSILLSLPIPISLSVKDGVAMSYIVIGINAYTGFASLTYLMSALLLLFNSWFYNAKSEMTPPYPDIDQLTSMTIRLEEEEEKTEGSE